MRSLNPGSLPAATALGSLDHTYNRALVHGIPRDQGSQLDAFAPYPIV
jgi:hypothetical protein